MKRMLKNIVFGIVLLSALFAGNASADDFQFVKVFSSDTAYMSTCSVKIYSNGKIVFNRYTDKYGRIRIKIGHGKYKGSVVYMRKIINFTIKIDGTAGIQVKKLK